MSLRSVRSRLRLISESAHRGAGQSNKGRLFLRNDWLRVTDCLSQDARRVLYLLIRASAQLHREEIPIDVNVLAAHLKTGDSCPSFRHCFAELRTNQLVREVRPGIFAIAAGLWRVGSVADKGFFAAPE